MNSNERRKQNREDKIPGGNGGFVAPAALAIVRLVETRQTSWKVDDRGNKNRTEN